MNPTPALVGVLGGGRMGAGIAHAFRLAGSRVLVVEQSPEAAASAQERVAGLLTASVERGKAPAPLEELVAGIETTTDFGALRPCALVVEAVPEDAALKLDVLRRAESGLEEGAWMASNTSSISIDALASSLLRPESFCGLHFFNPVPPSALVEVVRGERTAPGLVEAARDWVAAMGKTAIVVQDSPGFASSRLGVALSLEAMRMVEEDVASPADIDAAMVLGYRHQTGPLRTTDIVGLDVRLGIAEYLSSALGPRFEPPAILREMVARGDLGQKTGRGFYDWKS